MLSAPRINGVETQIEKVEKVVEARHKPIIILDEKRDL